MTTIQRSTDVTVVEEDLNLTLVELCRATRAAEEQVQLWVLEGVLAPEGDAPEAWRFTGPSLRRARLAQTLSNELGINPPGVALALDLLEELAVLRGQGRREAQ